MIYQKLKPKVFMLSEWFKSLTLSFQNISNSSSLIDYFILSSSIKVALLDQLYLRSNHAVSFVSIESNIIENEKFF